jgi:hypothetical protein
MSRRFDLRRLDLSDLPETIRQAIQLLIQLAGASAMHRLTGAPLEQLNGQPTRN